MLSSRNKQTSTMPAKDKIQFTNEQDAAIRTRDGDLLVAAAAGSGKTRVLVERLLEQIDQGADVSQFIIITYTRAAATELKSKILTEINERLATVSRDKIRHLRRQRALIPQAEIGTIHAFCARLIRRYAHVLGISPEFRVAGEDENESQLLLQQSLDDILKTRYAAANSGEDDGFSLLLETVSSSRYDSDLVRTIRSVREKLLSNPNPETWAQAQLVKWDISEKNDVAETDWGAGLLRHAGETAAFWREELLSVRAVIENDPALRRGNAAAWDEVTDQLAVFEQATKQSWDAAHAAREIVFPRRAGVQKKNYQGDLAVIELCNDLWNDCKKAVTEVTTYFAQPSKAVFADMQAMYPAIKTLVDMVFELERGYAAEKAKRGTGGILDFADLEQLATRLLINTETGEPSETAQELAAQYTELMVDEFQDVSRIQDLLFSALGKAGIRRFLVGDVKQSIYRFRLADPSIFQHYLRHWDDAGRDGNLVLLSKNFRSKPAILDAVNFVFCNIMSELFGEMEYGTRESLYPGKEPEETAEPTEPAVTLAILDKSEIPDDGTDARDLAEPRYAAVEIRRLQAQYGYAWSDFAILLRSVAGGKAQRYERALEAAGIPVTKQGAADVFVTPELSSVLSLLRCILNPLQDVPLVGAMRSPLFGFTPDELSEIRLANRWSGSFYEAVCTAAERDRKCARFLKLLNNYRAEMSGMTAEEFILHIYHETLALSIFGAMPNGQMRRQNLLAFLEYATQTGKCSVFDFVSRLERQLEGGNPPKIAANDSTNTVQILTIHKSKGLEFPVVFLPDLAKGFNRKDESNKILIHPNFGIAAERLDLARKIRYATPMQMAARKTIRRESLAEELRVLYVGMTRAVERLILSARLDDAKADIAKLSRHAGAPVSPQVLREKGCMIDWILLAALTRPEASFFLESRSEPAAPLPHPWKMQYVPYQPPAPQEIPPHQSAALSDCAPPIDIMPGALPDEILHRIQFAYPHMAAVNMPSKLTATGLKGRRMDSETTEDAAPAPNTEAKPRSLIFRRPAFVQETRPLTGAERGVATHLVLQHINFAACTSRAAIDAEVLRLTKAEFITESAAAAVDTGTISAFFQSELGLRVLTADAAGHVRREFKFSLLAPAADFLPNLDENSADEQVLLQGVIDLYLEESDGLLLIDFKTDYIPKGGSTAEKAAEYQGQMAAYAYALERITGISVKESQLYFFAANKGVLL